MQRFAIVTICLLIHLQTDAIYGQEYPPSDARLLTRWASLVNPEAPHQEYPRPQMRRAAWENLNGRWDYAITAKEAPLPRKFDGKIVVPFCVESALSGVGKRVGENQALWYQREFSLDAAQAGKRTLLHFGAVDWHSTIWINGKEAGQHRGGYDPFTIDITSLIKAPSAVNVVTVRVWDPTEKGTHPRGKQHSRPHGIWYTPVTGIWQTVWLEFVPKQNHIRGLKITTDPDTKRVQLQVDTAGDANATLSAVVDGVSKRRGRLKFLPIEGTQRDDTIEFQFRNVRLWSPDEPWLYRFKVNLLADDGTVIDSVRSYFGIRKISLGKDINGMKRLLLNGEPLFQFGPLDQGWWPDGLYTPPTEEAMVYDLEVTQRLGFNMVRKHVKVESARWYQWCDENGLLVWQDLPNGGKHAPWPRDGVEVPRDADSAKQYEAELKSMIDTHHNHPSIVMWVPFNEAWGQYDTVRIANWVQQYDPTRLVNAASGGNDFLAGHIDDDHFYPGPGASPALPDRAVALGEYGGLGLPLTGHTWQAEKNWGYRSFKDSKSLTQAYVKLIEKLKPLVQSHVAAAVYTQTTDVEVEVNGLMTYDRAVMKMDEQTITKANRSLYAPVSSMTTQQVSDLWTLAWWRFEEGSVAQKVANVKDQPRKKAAVDHSGHNNHLYAFGKPQSPAVSDDVPAAKLANGVENLRSLNDSVASPQVATMDLFTDPARSKTHMDMLNTFQFREWTIELSFKTNQADHFHGLVGKDGKPTDDPRSPLQFKVRGDDNKLQIEIIDGKGNVCEARSKTAIETGKWYHAAAVCDGESLRLYLDSGSGYELQSEHAAHGALFNRPGTWTLGRGFHDGKLADDARAWIDEVRVSAKAREPSDFLFAK